MVGLGIGQTLDGVSEAVAGTQALVQGMLLEPGEQPSTTKLRNGVSVPVAKASQIKHIVLKHCNDRIQPQVFTLEPMSFDFIAAMPKPPSLQLHEDDREHFKMRAIQLPLLCNNATTGHKLQGSGVQCLFVHSWRCVTNWAYVMLSRVKTKSGLHLRIPLSDDLSKHAVPQSLRQLIQDFRKRQPQFWTNYQYKTLFGASQHNS